MKPGTAFTTISAPLITAFKTSSFLRSALTHSIEQAFNLSRATSSISAETTENDRLRSIAIALPTIPAPRTAIFISTLHLFKSKRVEESIQNLHPTEKGARKRTPSEIR